MKKTWLVLLILSVHLASALSFVPMKQLYPVLDPRTIVFLRIIVSTLFFLVMGIRTWPKKIDPKDFLRIILCGLTGVFLNQFLFVSGLKHTLAAHSVVIITIVPVLVFLFSLLLGDERVSFHKMLGLVICISGILFLLDLHTLSFGADTLKGDLLTLGNASCYALYLALARPLSHKYSFHWITFMIFAVSIIPACGLGGREVLSQDWEVLSLHDWFNVFYIIFGMTVYVYGMVSFILKFTESSQIAMGIYIQPIVATLTSAYWLKEAPSHRLYVAMIAVFIGVAISQFGLTRLKLVPERTHKL